MKTEIQQAGLLYEILESCIDDLTQEINYGIANEHFGWEDIHPKADPYPVPTCDMLIGKNTENIK